MTDDAVDKPNNNKPKLEVLAERRNDLALQRTLLAIERNFSAWIRTGLAAVAAGLGIAHLLCAPGMPKLSCIIGFFFVLSGAIIFSVALRSYWKAHARMEKEGMPVTPMWVFAVLTILLAAGAILALFLLFLNGK